MIRLLFFLFFLSNLLVAQEVVQISCKEGNQLKEELRKTFYENSHTTLGYNDARRYMYGYIDNINDSNECIYSGYKRFLLEGTLTTYLPPINAEHIVPRSFFGGDVDAMLSDIHALAPTYEMWNSLRSNYKFNEIEENKITQWLLDSISYKTKPETDVEKYSKLGNNAFEPRDSKKGDIARSVLYFFTMYPEFDMNNVLSKQECCLWNFIDKVDNGERNRNNKIEQYQGNRNPFIDFPFLVSKVLDCPDSLGFHFDKPDTTIVINEKVFNICLIDAVTSVIENKIIHNISVHVPLNTKTLHVKTINPEIYTQVQIEVYDIMGRLVKNIGGVTIHNSEQTFDLSKVNSGLYFLKLHINSKVLYIGKFYL